MDDGKPFDESADEMGDCEDTLQDQPPMHSTCSTTSGIQILASDRQDKSENQQLPSDTSADMSSRHSVPNYNFSPESLSIDQLNEVLTREVFSYYRKHRNSTDFSRGVDLLLLPRTELKAAKGSRRNPKPLGIQDLPSNRQDAFQNQQTPSDISAEMSAWPSVLGSAGSLQVLNMIELDANPSSEQISYAARKLRFNSGCSPTVDVIAHALQNLATSSVPVLEHLKVSGAETNQIAQSPVTKSFKADSTSLPENVRVSVTRSLSKSRSSQETDSPSSEKQCVETSIGLTPTKRSRKPSEETQSASFMACSVAKALNLEHSRSWPIIEDPDLPSSSSEMLDSGIGTRGLTVSPSSCTVPNPHLPEQSSSSNINVPHHVLEFEISDDKKDGTDGNSSDSSTPISKPNAGARLESRKGSNLEVIRRSMSDEELTTSNVPENLAQQDRSNSLIKSPAKKSSKSFPEITKDVSQTTSRKRSDMWMDVSPPWIGEAARETLTYSHQPKITKGSSNNDRSNSSLRHEETGDTMGRTIESLISDDAVFIYASNAQKLFLTALGKIMNFDGERNQYVKFCNQCLPISESHVLSGIALQWKLMSYLVQRQDAWLEQDLTTPREITLEYHIEDAYEVLIRVVVTALISTMTKWSSLDYDAIIKNYETFKSFYNKCSLFWDGINEEELPDEAPGNRVKVLKEMIPELLLHTKAAFKMLLLHIGRNAPQSRIDVFVKKVWEEDKCFIRRNIQTNL